MDARNRTNRLSRNSLRTMAVISILRRAGCRVIEAHAHLSPPVVRVDREPVGVLAAWGFRPPPPGCVPVPVLCAGIRWGTRIEWNAMERHQ